jgi:hypothetical protein
MRKPRGVWIPGVVALMALLLAGCGGDSSQHIFDRLSDPSVDAYISSVIDPGTGQPTIFPATIAGSIQVGVDGGGTEYRGFLDFPIFDIPASAIVQFAYVEVFVGSVPFGANVPILVELVDFQPPILLGSDYYRTPPPPYLPPVLDRPIFNFYPDDAMNPRPAVRIDVTTLVQTAIARGQPDFQVRLLLDPSLPAFPAIVTLDDAAADTAPLLHVDFF